MRFAIADPPYPGMAHLYKNHKDYAGEVDHAALIEQLVADYPDGWTLSTHTNALRFLIPLTPPTTRVLAWCRTDATPLKGVFPVYAWEPVLLSGGRRGLYEKDFCAVPAFFDGNEQRAKLKGRKPPAFCFWLFRCLGARLGDEVVDLFPGSGAIGNAWETYQRQAPLPTTPAAKATQASLEGT